MMRRTSICTVGVLLLPRLASACPVCFGAADGPLLRGSSMGILALLIVTLGMFAAFGAFFLHLARRSSRSADVATPEAPRHWLGGAAR